MIGLTILVHKECDDSVNKLTFRYMRNLKIIGGIYREICIDPRSDNLYGSALRSALAISKGCEDLSLVGMVEPETKEKVVEIAKTFKFKVETKDREKEIEFIYDTPISIPRIYGLTINSIPTVEISASNIICFAMVEANIKVSADHLVVDPQGLSEIDGRISWSADHLAIVANKSEAAGFLNNRESLDPEVLAQKLREKYNAEVIVVKCGALGAVVLDSGGTQRVPAYYTNKINPIGSGDIFTSVFAFYWAEMRANPITAAENASKATTEWVMNGPLQVINFNKSVTAPNAEVPISGLLSKVYLAAPFFTVSERWLLDLCRSALTNLGATVFSPLHDVGVGNVQNIAFRDLEGLKASNSVFAVLDGMDPGTLFEIGYGIAMKKPVVIYVSNKKNYNLTMLKANNTHIHDNLASAIYDAIWLGI